MERTLIICSVLILSNWTKAIEETSTILTPASSPTDNKTGKEIGPAQLATISITFNNNDKLVQEVASAMELKQPLEKSAHDVQVEKSREHGIIPAYSPDKKVHIAGPADPPGPHHNGTERPSDVMPPAKSPEQIEPAKPTENLKPLSFIDELLQQIAPVKSTENFKPSSFIDKLVQLIAPGMASKTAKDTSTNSVQVEKSRQPQDHSPLYSSEKPVHVAGPADPTSSSHSTEKPGDVITPGKSPEETGHAKSTESLKTASYNDKFGTETGPAMSASDPDIPKEKPLHSVDHARHPQDNVPLYAAGKQVQVAALATPEESAGHNATENPSDVMVPGQSADDSSNTTRLTSKRAEPPSDDLTMPPIKKEKLARKQGDTASTDLSIPPKKGASGKITRDVSADDANITLVIFKREETNTKDPPSNDSVIPPTKKEASGKTTRDISADGANITLVIFKRKRADLEPPSVDLSIPQKKANSMKDKIRAKIPPSNDLSIPPKIGPIKTTRDISAGYTNTTSLNFKRATANLTSNDSSLAPSKKQIRDVDLDAPDLDPDTLKSSRRDVQNVANIVIKSTKHVHNDKKTEELKPKESVNTEPKCPSLAEFINGTQSLWNGLKTSDGLQGGLFSLFSAMSESVVVLAQCGLKLLSELGIFLNQPNNNGDKQFDGTKDAKINASTNPGEKIIGIITATEDPTMDNVDVEPQEKNLVNFSDDLFVIPTSNTKPNTNLPVNRFGGNRPSDKVIVETNLSKTEVVETHPKNRVFGNINPPQTAVIKTNVTTTDLADLSHPHLVVLETNFTQIETVDSPKPANVESNIPNTVILDTNPYNPANMESNQPVNMVVMDSNLLKPITENVPTTSPNQFTVNVYSISKNQKYFPSVIHNDKSKMDNVENLSDYDYGEYSVESDDQADNMKKKRDGKQGERRWRKRTAKADDRKEKKP